VLSGVVAEGDLAKESIIVAKGGIAKEICLEEMEFQGYNVTVEGEITKVGYTFVTIGSPNFRKTYFRPN
jgi:hypothetical protein